MAIYFPLESLNWLLISEYRVIIVHAFETAKDKPDGIKERFRSIVA